MLILNPETVRFESHLWDDATLVAVDRTAKRLIEDHSDLGPFAQFVDVPEQTITIRVQRTLRSSDVDDPALGESGDLVFYLAPPAADLDRKRISIHCTVISIRTDLPTAARPPVKTITFIGHTDDASDPLSTSPAPVSE